MARWVQSHPRRTALPQGASRAWRPAPADTVSAKASLEPYTVFFATAKAGGWSLKIPSDLGNVASRLLRGEAVACPVCWEGCDPSGRGAAAAGVCQGDPPATALLTARPARVWFRTSWVRSLISRTYRWKWKQPAALMCIGADWCSSNLLSLGFVGFDRAASTFAGKIHVLACMLRHNRIL